MLTNLPDPSIILTLGIIIAAVVLFATERLRVDVIAMLVLLTVAFTGLVPAHAVFEGFANPAVVTVWAVYIVSGGLFITGVADMIGARILKVAGHSEPRLVATIMLTCGTMSAFMNNIGATAVLMPAVIAISKQANVPAARLLMPLAFSSLLGGNMTLIGTPPNVLAASALSEQGLPTLAFFDFAPTGIIIFLVGIIYMVLIGRHLIPVRQTDADLEAEFVERRYVSEVRVPAEQSLVGRSLFEARLGADFDLQVLHIVRADLPRVPAHRDTIIQADDLLVVEGRLEDLMRMQETLGLPLEAEHKLGIVGDNPDDHVVIEATLAPRASIEGRSLRGLEFRERFGFTVLAIRRHGSVITQRLRDARLRFGDTLLLKGPRHRLESLQGGNDFLVLEPVSLETRRVSKAPIALGILALVLVLVTAGGIHVSIAMVTGALLMVLTRCLTMDEAYQSIEWRSIFLIAGMLPLGTAMELTGTARYLAAQLVEMLGGHGPPAIMAGIYVLSSLITQPMSNAAATVLIAPISIDIALGLGADPRPFVLATVIGASTSFLTPVGHQANVLIFGVGGYRFTDYTRVGLPLSILLIVTTLLVLPWFWPMFP